MSNVAMIFAGGTGQRMNTRTRPKQFLELHGKPIIIYTLEAFEDHSEIDGIIVVMLESWIPYTKELIRKYNLKKVKDVVPGGASGQDSIYNGLCAAARFYGDDDIVLIHDGVRPFVSYDVISRNIQGVKDYGSAITATACYETIIISKDGKGVDAVPFRKETFTAQAPQSFYLKDIIAAHDYVRSLSTGYSNMVDACTIMTSQGKSVHLVEGNRGNIKVTTPEDVYTFRALMQYRENEQAFGLGGLSNEISARMRQAGSMHRDDK